jgi:hypothetical protein
MGTWKTRDGTVLKIVDMDDFHIINCLLAMRKSAIRSVARKVVNMYYGGHLPDDAKPEEDEFESWWQSLVNNNQSWRNLHSEAVNRGLDMRSLEDDSEAYGMLHVFLAKEADRVDKTKYLGKLIKYRYQVPAEEI